MALPRGPAPVPPPSVASASRGEFEAVDGSRPRFLHARLAGRVGGSRRGEAIMGGGGEDDGRGEEGASANPPAVDAAVGASSADVGDVCCCIEDSSSPDDAIRLDDPRSGSSTMMASTNDGPRALLV